MKKFNSSTKISQLIKADKNVIEVLIEVNKNFSRLKNPVLRKLLAGRVNISQAAKIGGVDESDIIKALVKMGFIYEEGKSSTIDQSENNTITTPNISQLEKIELDVRPILESGVDPFKQIMSKLKTLNDSQALVIINKFEPIPLLNILKEKGYHYSTTRNSNDEVHTCIYKTGERFYEEPKKEKSVKADFNQIQERYQSRLTEIDVRDLEMPMPMVKILEAIENISDNDALFVHHKKLPQYLIPELEKRNFQFVSKEIDESNIKLIIYKS